MRLFLHVGTEKTGSSFLQKVCAINRDWLRLSKVYFPKAGRDERRLKGGTISPGNARELASLINAGDWIQVESWLVERVKRANSNSCEVLLLSHELLFQCFGNEGAVGELQRILQEVGVKQVSSLMFIRDPVDHALSLYKHRGKSGSIGPVDEWVQSSYSTAAELESLLRLRGSSFLNLEFRKYQKRTSILVQRFFGDWLRLDSPPLIPDELVNPSLTLSEIELLRLVAKTHTDDIPIFYRNLLAVPTKVKSKNEVLESNAREAAINYLAGYASIWQEYDGLLEGDGGLTVPERVDGQVVVDEAFSFSAQQLQAIVKSYSEAASLQFKMLVFFNRYIRPTLGRLKRVIFP